MCTAMPQIPHSSNDLLWMRNALDLAREMRGHVWPNPPVGCVIVKDDAAIARAATHAGGRPHAERKALDQAGARAVGATLYVTLEPCCHWGKTPPCVDAIIEARVSRVVCAIRDPDPRVNGGGFEKLRNCGVEIVIGLCAEEAQNLMSGFFHRVRYGEPELVLVERPMTTIPAGIDAMLASSNFGVHVRTRSGDAFVDIDMTDVPKAGLLTRLAGLGLTSIAAWREDPVARSLTGMGDPRSNVGTRCSGETKLQACS